MKTDRELLELAAKAAGIEQGAERSDCGISTTLPDGRHGHLPRWNPLIDDGDALRLAVELGIEIHPDLEVDTVITAFVIRGKRTVGKNTIETFDGDPTGATRRAIVRAAAEIGEDME